MASEPEFDFEVELLYQGELVQLPLRARTPKLAVQMAVYSLAAEHLISTSDVSAIVPVSVSQVLGVVGRCEKCESWCFEHEIGSRNRKILCEVCK